jgi:hypothetical protein
MDKFQLINAVIAGSAILVGLYSRKFTAALAVWFWLAVIHSGLILLAMGQAGSTAAPELPMLGDVLAMVAQAVDAGIKWAEAAQTYVSLAFANAALVAYFVVTIGILLGLVFAAFLIRLVLTGLAYMLMPPKVRASA